MHSVLAAIGALVPPVGVGLIFWFVLRAIIRADRSERAAIARLDAAEAMATAAEGNAEAGLSSADSPDVSAQ